MTKLKTLFVAASLALSSLAQAGVDTFTDANDIALAGHDAVAYFIQNKPVVGNKEFTAIHNDAIYRFSNKQNRDKFNANPEKYAPAYGGFCAYGTTFGKKFEVNGKAFEIVDGKLYVNKNEDVYKLWKEDVPKHLREANAEWPKIEFVDGAEL